MVAAPAAAAVTAAPRAFVPVLHEGDAVPDIALVAQDGRRFSFHATGGSTTIVSFIYTRCPDMRMCPLVAAKFARMQRALHGPAVRLVTVTLDPAYDTPAVLARYGASYRADPAIWTLATTSTPATADELAGRFGITVERPGPGIVTHTEAAIVVDADGRVAKIVDGAAWAPDDLVASARAVAGVDANFARRIGLWLGSSASALCGGGAGGISAGATLAILAASAAAFGLVARRLIIRRR